MDTDEVKLLKEQIKILTHENFWIHRYNEVKKEKDDLYLEILTLQRKINSYKRNETKHSKKTRDLMDLDVV
jgi:hypothetical protein